MASPCGPSCRVGTGWRPSSGSLESLLQTGLFVATFRHWIILKYLNTYWDRREGLPIQLLPVREVEVKAQIARPALHEVVPANSVYRIHGAAWTGESMVTKVEVSTDGGCAWETAQLLGPSTRFGWRLWGYHWRTPSRVGRHTIMARATDARGHAQPMQRDRHRGNYIISHIQPIEVEVQ